MGCVCSRVEEDETLQRCRDRRRLMKQLLSCRRELAAAHMAYLHSLRNTGVTLRQFTEVEPIIPGGNSPLGIRLPPSPPPPLPPSPPPPPAFSPEEIKGNVVDEVHSAEENLVELDDDESCTPPPLPVLSSEWDFWDPFGPPTSSNSSSLVMEKKDDDATPVADVEEENWAETKSEFGEEEVEGVEEIVNANVVNLALKPVKVKSPLPELTDDCLSMVSGYTKDTDLAVVVWRSKKTLAGIVKELDDYFLKAAAGGKDVAGFLEDNQGPRLHSGFEQKWGKLI